MEPTSAPASFLSGNGLLITAVALAAAAIIVLVIALVLALRRPKLPPSPTVAVRRNRVNEPYVPPEVSGGEVQQPQIPVMPERPADAPVRARPMEQPAERVRPAPVQINEPAPEPPARPQPPVQQTPQQQPLPFPVPSAPASTPAPAPAPVAPPVQPAAPVSMADTGPIPNLADTGRVRVPKPRVYCIAGFGEGTAYPVGAQAFMIGRDPTRCAFVYPGSSSDISRQHCSVKFDSVTGNFILEDCGSTNGTYMEDGGRLEARAPYSIAPGARFYLANPGHQFEVNLDEEA